ncbi:MAG: hypothetical protein ACK5JT_23585, partial [Hyphomicrobiaceae bacterium]
MSITRLVIFAAAAIAVSGTSALAHSSRGIDKTQAWQARQIQDGRDNGQLTRREYRNLVQEQNRISHLEHKLKRRGLTGRAVRVL